MSYLSSNSLTLCHFSDSTQPQWHLPQLGHQDYPFAQIMKESGVCQPSTLPHQLGLHHLPCQTIPWTARKGASIAKDWLFSDALFCLQSSARGPSCQAFPTKDSYHAWHFCSWVWKGSLEAHWIHSKVTLRGLPWLCSLLLYPITPEKYLSHHQYLLTHQSPLRGYILYGWKKEVILPLITP